jgi:hypothetical protein
LPLTERWPWLIYVILSAVVIVLLGILAGLAGAAVRTHDQRVASVQGSDQ